MAINLTPERVIELLREVVAEFGEGYVYTTPNGETPLLGRRLVRQSNRGAVVMRADVKAQ